MEGKTSARALFSRGHYEAELISHMADLSEEILVGIGRINDIFLNFLIYQFPIFVSFLS